MTPFNKIITDIMAHPLTRGMSLDDPTKTELRRYIIREKSFLIRIYNEWYQKISASLMPDQRPVLEVGSGGGFMEEFIPGLITSEVFYLSFVSLVLDGLYLPLADNSLGAIVMVNVLHHLTDNVRNFFTNAARCIRKKGTIIMIEPWVTPWSKVIYGKLHHEAFKPDAVEWECTKTGPLSGANSALPWILFSRDRQKFEDEFPEWHILQTKPMMPFLYLLSGGVSMRSFMPKISFNYWRSLEKVLSPWMPFLGMFAQITLQKR